MVKFEKITNQVANNTTIMFFSFWIIPFIRNKVI